MKHVFHFHNLHDSFLYLGQTIDRAPRSALFWTWPIDFLLSDVRASLHLFVLGKEKTILNPTLTPRQVDCIGNFWPMAKMNRWSFVGVLLKKQKSLVFDNDAAELFD